VGLVDGTEEAWPIHKSLAWQGKNEVALLIAISPERVLQVDMRKKVRPPLGEPGDIISGEDEVAGIKCQAEGGVLQPL
jgi:hypothetical protein